MLSHGERLGAERKTEPAFDALCIFEEHRVFAIIACEDLHEASHPNRVPIGLRPRVAFGTQTRLPILKNRSFLGLVRGA